MTHESEERHMIGFRPRAAGTRTADTPDGVSPAREFLHVCVYAAVVAPLVVGVIVVSGAMAGLADESLSLPVRSGVGAVLILAAGIVARPGIGWLRRRGTRPRDW
jgi:hypothetical protein